MNLISSILRVKNIFLLIIGLTFSLISFAQQNQHFILHSTNPDLDLTVYENAVENWGGLDKFRLLDKRRTISFFDVMGNEGVTIELFSAQELLNNNGTQISAHTITKEEDIYMTVFVLTPDRLSIKPKIEK
ncbi:MAG: hypothetical protein VR77_08045 [Flavobacteriales bacterium BRH_c54]|nr:MAG: hypothetical protein VR77_08045 [Flavobacteriales bacterium BRH_c54]